MTVSMSIAESNELFAALPESTRNAFYAVAGKSDMGTTAREFFHSEIPDVLKSDPVGIDVLMNGGTVTVPVDTFEYGRASTGVDTVEYTMPDRDFSRIESGVNGGDYTTDNVVLENSSINRARGGTDMTDVELDTATESLASDAELIAERIEFGADAVVSDVADAAGSAGDVFGTVLESVLPVTVGAKLAHSVWKSTDHMDTTERVGTTALAAGVGVGGTALVLANPVGAAVVTCVGLWKLGNLGVKLANKYL